MSQPYLVHVKSSATTSRANQEQVHVLQVVAETPEEAAGAIRRAVGPAAVVEVDPAPLSAERAVDAGVIAGKVLLA